jgi:hypothetical protein
MTYYIIEHPTRGTFRDWRDDYGSGVSKPSFSWTGKRSDPDKAKRFNTIDGALSTITLFPMKIGVQCVVRQSPARGKYEWEVVA